MGEGAVPDTMDLGRTDRNHTSIAGHGEGKQGTGQRETSRQAGTRRSIWKSGAGLRVEWPSAIFTGSLNGTFNEAPTEQPNGGR